MYTSSFDEENKTKPAIIESMDEGLTADQAVQGLFKGVENGKFHIMADLITSIFRALIRGCAQEGTCCWKLLWISSLGLVLFCLTFVHILT